MALIMMVDPEVTSQRTRAIIRMMELERSITSAQNTYRWQYNNADSYNDTIIQRSSYNYSSNYFDSRLYAATARNSYGIGYKYRRKAAALRTQYKALERKVQEYNIELGREINDYSPN
jgi:hypothetical protein